MTVHLPEELERFVRSEVASGHFASENDAISEAVRLLRQRTNVTTSEPKALSEQEFAQKLVQSGLLSAVPPRFATPPGDRNFQPVDIQGEPLSETVIRERR
jgi:putative addiction module CopG family antidote